MKLKILLPAILLSQQLYATESTVKLADLSREMAEANYFGDGTASFITYCEGASCQSAASGYTTLDRKLTVTEDNLITVGSNSKYITAVLTLRLVDRGLLNLSDKLADFFPDYAQWGDVTVRDLLNHSSGIPEYIFSKNGINRLLRGAFNWHSRKWKPRDIVNVVAKEPSIFPVGSKVEYNNTNYVLLGMIAEKVTNRALADLLHELVFVPAGMESTYLELPANAKSLRIEGYTVADLPVPGWFINLFSRKIKKIGPYLDTTNIFDSSFVWAAGGIVSNPRDLAKLTYALFHGELISPELLTEMKKMRLGSILGFVPIEYGLGLMRSPSILGDGYGHGGLVPGYQVLTYYYPDHDLTISMARNIGPGQLDSEYYDLLSRLSNLENEKTFTENSVVSSQELTQNGVHLRLKGRLSDGQIKGERMISDSFGYAELKENGRRTLPFSTFKASEDQSQGRSELVLEAKSSLSFLDIGNTELKAVPVLTVVVAQDDLRNAPEALIQTQNSAQLFAYKGREKLLVNGKASEFCVTDVIDSTRVASLQIQGAGAFGFKAHDSIKLAGNIPLRKIRSGEVIPELLRRNLQVCAAERK